MKKIFAGIVRSVAMQKTVVVEVVNKKPHPVYKKLLTRSKAYKADSGKFTLKIGDKVKIGETRPLSLGKHFEVTEVIK